MKLKLILMFAETDEMRKYALPSPDKHCVTAGQLGAFPVVRLSKRRGSGRVMKGIARRRCEVPGDLRAFAPVTNDRRGDGPRSVRATASEL